MNKFTLLLNQKEIKECITDQEIFNTVDEVFRGHGVGKIIMPAKITLNMKASILIHGSTLCLPC